jgi:uncharacterized delta-60 repeat protein
MQRKSRTHRVSKILVEALESRQLLSGGGLDTSFNNGHGTDSISLGPVSVKGYGMAVQSDGKIVEVGSASNGEIALIRFNTDGTLDKTFGPVHNGIALVSIRNPGAKYPDVAHAVAIQPDGKIVVVGEADIGATMFVARFNPDGTLDKSFDTDGVVGVSGDDADAVAIENGKIIVAGSELEGFLNPNDNLIVARLNGDGSIDTSFGTGGRIDLDLGENEDPRAIAIDNNDTPATNPDYGKIIIVGHQATDFDHLIQPDLKTTDKILIARYLANGKPDTSFNGSGVLVTTANDGAKSTDADAVTIESGGKIVVAGSAGTNFGSNDHNFFTARFTVNGALDKSFGIQGNTVSDFGGNDYAQSIIVGGFGQQLIVGGTSNGKFALAALTLDGHPFSGFGVSGKVITTVDNSTSIDQLALAPNHTIVAAGGPGFDTARFFDIAPGVSISSNDPTAGPPTMKHIGLHFVQFPNFASMTVTRDQSEPFATRVFFTVGGTALPPTPDDIKSKKNNYTLSGMTILPAPASAKTFSGYVDIPAGQTSVAVIFTPNTIPAATTTATFTIQSNGNYGTSLPSNQTITLLGTNPAPVSTSLTATADMYVQDGSAADTNFGTATQLFVRKSSATGGNQQTYLMFDLSSLSTVNSVKLTLFGALNNTDQASLVTQLFSVADTSWLETGMTWNKKRAVSASPLASATITGTTPQTVTFDVTAYVKAQLAKGIKVVSFALINSTASTSAILFNSREAAGNKPTLVVS